MWTNKQHIMSRLGRGHRVIYVDPATTPARPRGARSEDGVTVLRFWTPRSALRLRHGHPLRVLLEFDLRVAAVERWLARARIDDAIVWVYHPGFGDRVARIPHKLLVYDCVDEY